VADSLTFDDFDFFPVLNEALKKCGYKTPSPIQSQAIPHLKEGKDFLGIAQTGTGKTAAFALPLLDRLARNKKKARPARMRALILTPTRELASQIYESLKIYGKGLAFSNACIYGGVGISTQIRTMGKGVDILVATPGRLLDLIREGCILFNQLETFILDEADRMLDMGFIRDVKKIIEKLPEERQTAFFSATMAPEILALSETLLKDPVKVEVDPSSSTVETIQQNVKFVEMADKANLLKKILRRRSVKSALVFTKTKEETDRVAHYLEKSYITVASLHGDKTQIEREYALSLFRKGKIKVLVATDIASRGIDIPHVGLVVNYNIPENPENYVHRIGRTARAGRSGMALSFCSKEEKKLLFNIEDLINLSIPVQEDSK
jgi:ATP-dependent RNA helicase RhlE